MAKTARDRGMGYVCARSKSEINEATWLYMDIAAYRKYLEARQLVASGELSVDPAIWAKVERYAKKFESLHGLAGHDDFDWGMALGALSALKWLIGGHWRDVECFLRPWRPEEYQYLWSLWLVDSQA